MLVTLFILFNGWILYRLLKPSEETVESVFEIDEAPLQVEIASLHHERKIIEVEDGSMIHVKKEASDRD